MAQHDYSLANAAGASVRSDINDALAAIVSQNSGASAPSTTFAYMWWADTTTGLLKLRNAANSAWITVGTLASAYLGLLPLSGGTLTAALNMAPTVDVASASTCDLGAAASNSVRITGTTTITSLGTVAAGVVRYGYFAAALTLTHHATQLILPGGSNITTAANDRFVAMSLGSGNWIVMVYQRASGAPVVTSTLDYIRMINRAPDGTHGGTAVASAWYPRGYADASHGWVEIADTASRLTVDPANKRFALLAGTYEWRSWSAFYAARGVRLRLYNITDAAVALAQGMSGHMGNTSTHATNFFVPLMGRFTIAGTKTFELQYYCGADISSYGLGHHDELALDPEIYDDVTIRVIA